MTYFMPYKFLVCLVISFGLVFSGHVRAETAASFYVNNMLVPLPLFSVFVLPGESVSLSVPAGLSAYEASDKVNFTKVSPDKWQLTATKRHGIFRLIEPVTKKTVFQLNLLVVIPHSEVSDGLIDQYQIGQYPEPRRQFNVFERPPKGFLRVSPRMVDMPLTPTLILRRFISKQNSDFPKYLYVNEKLLLLLESFLKEVKRQGYSIDSFSFVSGFRTPYYNAQLGNIEYSRHIFGDAADIYIDADGNKRLDDLNRDGLINQSDTKFLIGLAERFKKSVYGAQFVGGIGHYPPTRHHGGFIHLDTRGYKARW